ncbi:MAG TPA: ATP-binding protein, partial [Candidatus Binatus sp.]|nr:ATP-binding protein [Candidatus Binatus sp.]
VFGATGSGKTVLSKSIVEAAALAGVPVLAIDPKGDIGTLAVHPGSSDSKSDLRQTGFDGSGLNTLDVARFDRSVEVRIFTPRSGMGIPVSLSPRLEAPGNFKSVMEEDPPLAYEMLEITSSTIGKLVGFKEEDKVKLAFIAAIIEHYWTRGSAVEIQDLVTGVRLPPFEKFGELKVDDVFERKERAELITRMNLLLTDPGIKSWFIGEPVDFDRWFTVKEKVPINVVDLRGVAGEAERQVFVEYLLEQLFFWMMRQKGSQALKYLLYFDEIHGFCPPVRAPASKKILIRLVKMARAFGLGMVLATQNPSDLDYKVLSNANIRFIGNLPMKQDIERVRLGLDLGTDTVDTLSGLKKMEFYCQIFDKNEGFLTVPGQLISQHGGPLELNEVRKLMKPLKEEWALEEISQLEPGKKSSGKHETSRDPKIVPDSLHIKVDFDEVSKSPLHGPVSLKELKLRFDPYYIFDYEVNTWKQFPHYQKEVRIDGKGTLIVDAEYGGVVNVKASGQLSRPSTPVRNGLSDSLAKTLVTGESGTVEAPENKHLTTEGLSKVKERVQVELRTRQYVSDCYDKQVKLVGVRTSRVVNVKPSARDI